MEDQGADRDGNRRVKATSLRKRTYISVALIALGLGVFAFAALAFPYLDNALIVLALWAGCTALVGAGLGSFFGRPIAGIVFVVAIEIIVFLSQVKFAHIVGIIFPTT